MKSIYNFDSLGDKTGNLQVNYAFDRLSVIPTKNEGLLSPVGDLDIIESYWVELEETFAATHLKDFPSGVTALKATGGFNDVHSFSMSTRNLKTTEGSMPSEPPTITSVSYTHLTLPTKA